MPVASERQAGHIQRIAKGLTYGGRRIDKDPGHPRFFRQIGNQARANHRLRSAGFQLVDLPARILFGDIAALLQAQIERLLKGG
ncbi:hypothetical protein D3C73_1221160 [compost metagenome]